MKRNRTLLVVAVVLMLTGWFAWKVLLTANTVPSAPPAAQNTPS